MPTRVTDLFPTIAGTSAPIDVEDEGVSVDAAANKLNFVGDGVTVTDGPEEGEVTVTVPGGGGGGGTVRDWDMSTDTVTLPIELAVDPSPLVPYDAGQVLGTETLSLPTTDTTSRFAGASVVEAVGFGSAQWILFRATTATGTLLANQNFISLFGGDPVGDPANAFGISYRPVEDDLYNPFTAAVIDAAFTLNDWALVIFDPSVPETRVITASVNTVISTAPISGQPIRTIIQSQTSAGTGNLALEVSTDVADLGALNPGAATPMGNVQVVLPGAAVVGDFLNVTVGGTYEGTVYAAGDGAVYLDDTPADVVNQIPNASKVTNVSKVANVPSTYATIGEAIDYLAGFKYVGDATGTVLIDSGASLVADEQYVSIVNKDYSWLRINTVDNVDLDFTTTSNIAMFEIYNSKVGAILGTWTDVSPGFEYRALLRIDNSEVNEIGSISTPLVLDGAQAGVTIWNTKGLNLNVEVNAGNGVNITSSFLNLNYNLQMVCRTDGYWVEHGGNESRLVIVNEYTGGDMRLDLAGGETIATFDGGFAEVGFNVHFIENNATNSPQMPATGYCSFVRTGAATYPKCRLKGSVADGCTGELSMSDRAMYKVNATNDIFFSLGNGSKLYCDLDGNNIDVSSFVPNAIFELGYGAFVQSGAGLTKTTEYTIAYGNVGYTGANYYLQEDIISPDGALIKVGSGEVLGKTFETMSATGDIPFETMGRTLQVNSAGGAVIATVTTEMNDSVFKEFWVERAGANDVTLAAAVGVTLTSVSGNLKIADGGRAHVRWIASDTWVASGDLIP